MGASAERRIDARGLVVAPGVIDIQAQSYAQLLYGDSRVVSMITQGVKDLQRPVGESIRNTQRLRRVVDKLAAEFEAMRRERHATQRDGWDALELETFDSYAQIRQRVPH